MPSPFDYVNSAVKTKKSIIDSEELFQKEYAPFIINRVLANDPSTCLFAEVLNDNSFLDKKLQYDLIFYGLPKTNKYLGYTKKQKLDVNEEFIDFIRHEMGVSYKRAFEVLNIVGEDSIRSLIEKRGGKCTTVKKTTKNKN